MEQEQNVLGSPKIYCDICGAMLVDGVCPNNCLGISAEVNNDEK